MNIGQTVTVLRPSTTAGQPAIAEVAFVVKKGTANVPDANGGAPVKQPYVNLRVLPARGGELPYLERVPAFDTEDDARAEGAGRWSAYTCFADPTNESADLGIPDTEPEPAPPAAPVVVPEPTFEDDAE